MTPVRRQYRAIKRQYPDIIVFFRLGDFTRRSTAMPVTVAEVLGITLTSREMGKATVSRLLAFPITRQRATSLGCWQPPQGRD
ncbi:MAG: hypothetical protein M9890_03700 [Thermomicrobiales bacterium]|nr:hypothetical protein [Thermomicrobiales bacterium]